MVVTKTKTPKTKTQDPKNEAPPKKSTALLNTLNVFSDSSVRSGGCNENEDPQFVPLAVKVERCLYK